MSESITHFLGPKRTMVNNEPNTAAGRTQITHLNHEINLKNILKFSSYLRDSVVGIATGYGLDDRGVGVQVPVG
jgi:hypothetical protein